MKLQSACRLTKIWSTSEVKETDSETAKNQAVLQSLSTTYSWLCKVNTDTKRRERKVRDKGKAYPEKKVPKRKKKKSLWSTRCYSREESRTHTDRHACRNVASGPIWARRHSLAGMAWRVIGHEDSSGYNVLRDGQSAGGKNNRLTTGRIWAKQA